MPKPFDKIASGLKDAIAFANGDSSKARFATPVNTLDVAARRAFRKARMVYDIAAQHEVGRRTVERIAAGKRDVPPRLARSIADHLRAQGLSDDETVESIAAPLLAWADSREAAQHG